MKILSASTVRNEGPYLLEWIAWHQVLGVTDFLVYSNDCDDGSDLLLNRLAEHGVLVHETHQPQPDRSIQWSALSAAWKHPLRKAADWMLISDLDEFPVIHTGEGRLTDLIGSLSDIQACGCDLYLHQQAVDTSTPSGRMLFQMLSVFAEFERALIRER